MATRATRARAPKPGTTSGNSDGPTVFEIGFANHKWRLAADAVSPLDVADLRRVCGFGAREVFTAMAESNLDLDYCGALVFLARRQSENRRITFEDATAGLTVKSGFAYGIADDEGEDGPEG